MINGNPTWLKVVCIYVAVTSIGVRGREIGSHQYIQSVTLFTVYHGRLFHRV